MSEKAKKQKKSKVLATLKAKADKVQDSTSAEKVKVDAEKAEEKQEVKADPNRIKKPGSNAGGASQTLVKMKSMLSNRPKGAQKYYPSKCKH